MDTGDVILHKPSGEKWVVAFVTEDMLCCCGWPKSYAKLSDCELVTPATAEERERLLWDMARISGEDRRKRYAQHRLAQAEQILPKEQ